MSDAARGVAYDDTSALVKLVVRERESAALEEALIDMARAGDARDHDDRATARSPPRAADGRDGVALRLVGTKCPDDFS